MDILTNKSKKTYDYLSRYANFSYYYNTEDKKYIYGLTQLLDQSTGYVTIDVDSTITLDYLANKYYGRPDYFWVIADFNRITDPFVPLYPRFQKLKIPNIGAIQYEESVRYNK